MTANFKLAIQWPSFGPYHLARLRACQTHFSQNGCDLVAIETAAQSDVYHWTLDIRDRQNNFDHVLGFPETPYQKIPASRLRNRMVEMLDQAQPHAIAVNGYNFPESRIIRKWCRKNDRALVLMSDSKADDTPRYIIKEYVKKILIKNFDAFFCAGPIHKDYLVRLGAQPDKIFLGYDVVDNDFFLETAQRLGTDKIDRSLPGLESQDSFFLASSRFLKIKNLDFLLMCYQKYSQTIAKTGKKPWRLVILGDGEEWDSLNRLISELGITGITLAGFRTNSELPHYFAAAKVFVHPSTRDTWGLVVNEAMASGLPVLVSKAAGCSDSLVEEGGNGFRFDPFSQTELVARMIDFHGAPPEKLAAFGQRSIEIIRHWSPQTFAENILKAFHLALASKT